MRKAVFILTVIVAQLASSGAVALDLDERLKSIKLPAGFSICVYARGVANARQLALGDRGIVFAGSNSAGKVYAMEDTDRDNVAERVYVIDKGLSRPSGVEFRNGALYVAVTNRILRYDDIEASPANPPEPRLITAAFPDKSHHGMRYLRFGPDGFLYVPVGAPCNVCEEPGFAEIRRLRPDGGEEEVYALGIRNSVGLAFHPDTGELWFTDNGRDLLGDDLPSDELNHATTIGQNFGFPYCHQGDLADPEFGGGRYCADFTSPVLKLGAHVAALGLTFYTGEMFPPAYRRQMFIARHGSWNRSEKVGYDIVLVTFGESGRPPGLEVFASGWLQGQDAWGRPNDVLQMKDGSLLISDDTADAVYRISFAGN